MNIKICSFITYLQSPPDSWLKFLNFLSSFLWDLTSKFQRLHIKLSKLLGNFSSNRFDLWFPEKFSCCGWFIDLVFEKSLQCVRLDQFSSSCHREMILKNFTPEFEFNDWPEKLRLAFFRKKVLLPFYILFFFYSWTSAWLDYFLIRTQGQRLSSLFLTTLYWMRKILEFYV